MKIRSLKAELFHAEGRKDGWVDMTKQLDVFLTVHHELTIY